MIDSGCMLFRMLFTQLTPPVCEIYAVKPMFFPVHVRISVRDFVVVVAVLGFFFFFYSRQK